MSTDESEEPLGVNCRRCRAVIARKIFQRLEPARKFLFEAVLGKNVDYSEVISEIKTMSYIVNPSM